LVVEEEDADDPASFMASGGNPDADLGALSEDDDEL